jgi:hypothetical protein
MDNPSTLRRKAARFFENAASSTTAREAEKLNEVGRQLELWADDLEEIDTAHEQKTSKPGNARCGERIHNRARAPGADTHS